MKKLYILGLAVSTAMCVPLAAQASDGMITFNGVLNASTCTVSTGTTGNFTVTLPTLAASTLSVTGATAGATPFAITVAGCTSGEATFTPYFEAGVTTDLLLGHLNITAGLGQATNVQLQLLNSNTTPINVAAIPGAQGVLPAAIVGGTGTGNYIVRYWATGAAGAGVVTSQVTYSMVYI